MATAYRVPRIRYFCIRSARFGFHCGRGGWPAATKYLFSNLRTDKQDILYMVHRRHQMKRTYYFIYLFVVRNNNVFKSYIIIAVLRFEQLFIFVRVKPKRQASPLNSRTSTTATLFISLGCVKKGGGLRLRNVFCY